MKDNIEVVVQTSAAVKFTLAPADICKTEMCKNLQDWSLPPPFTRIRIRSCRMQQRRSFLLWICIGFGIFFLLHSTSFSQSSGGVGPARKLLESSESTSDRDWVEIGEGVLCFLGICYLFCGISIVCDDFFVNALNTISERLNLSTDVAGATFIAAGSSAPELFMSLVALADSNVSNDVEIGTVVGATAFNMFAIVGVIVLFSGSTLRLDYRPLLRDGLFYVVAIAGVMGVFYDGKIYWWEGLIFVVLYGVYILAMKLNERIMDMLPSPFTKYVVFVLYGTIFDVFSETTFDRFNANGVDLESLHCEHLETSTSDEEISNGARVSSNATPLLPSTTGELSAERVIVVQQDDRNGTTNTDNLVEYAQSTEDNKNPLSAPKGKLAKLYWILLRPWRFSFHYTIPDCSKQDSKQWYIVTFVVSMIWILGISFLMVKSAAHLDSTLGIPGDVMGETVLAIGISLRIARRSIIAARAGKGDLDAANAIGSNVFDIWLGLGLPWLLVIPFVGVKDSFGKYIEVDNTELLPCVAIVLGLLVFFVLLIVATHCTLYKRHGAMLLAVYIVFVLYNVIAVWIFNVYH